MDCDETPADAPVVPDWSELHVELWPRVFYLLWQPPVPPAAPLFSRFDSTCNPSVPVLRAVARARLVCSWFAAGIAAAAPRIEPSYWPGPPGWRVRFPSASTVVCKPLRRTRWGVGQDYYSSEAWTKGQPQFPSELDTTTVEHGVEPYPYGKKEQRMVSAALLSSAPHPPVLYRLDIRGCNGLGDAWLSTELSRPVFSSLRCFHLKDAEISHYQGLGTLTNLRSLSLRSCSWLEDAALLGLESLLQLKTLDLGYCCRITEVGVAALKPLTGLTFLSFEGCQQVDDKCMVALQTLTNVTHLNLSLCTKLTASGLAALYHLKNLAELDLTCLHQPFWEITVSVLCSACSPTALTSLRLDHWSPRGNEASVILHELLNRYTRLEDLSLQGWPPADSFGLCSLEGLTHLKTLNLSGCSAFARSDVKIDPLTNLTSLDLSSPISEIPGHWISQLSALTNLTSLNLANCQPISDAGIRNFHTLRKLASLNLSSCACVTAEDCHVLSQLPGLSHLNLSRSKVTADGIRYLHVLSTLRTLDLSSCRDLNDCDIAALASIPALETLRLTYCRGITDTGITALQRLSSLTDLDMGYCVSVTDHGASALESLALLISLNLTGCQAISSHQRRRLLDSISGLLIFDNATDETEQ